MAPRWSVVMAAFDAERTVAGAMGSVLDQPGADLELIVVDDGSRDGTPDVVGAIAQRDARVRWTTQDNAGPSAARNAGIALARGELVAVLDSDDLWLPSYVAEVERALAARPGAGFAYTDAWAYDVAARRFEVRSTMALQRPPAPPPEAPHDLLRELITRNFVFSSVTFRRSALDAVGSYDTTIPQAEDYELVLRLLAHGLPAAWVPGRQAVKRTREDSLSSDLLEGYEGLVLAYTRVIDDHPAPDDVKATARALREDARRELEGLGAPAARARRRARQAAGRARRRLLPGGRLLREPPAAVVARFPELAPPARRRGLRHQP